MSGGVYGGDEVGALVFDSGHCSFRVGYAGEELPKADIPSRIGVTEALDKVKDEAMDTDESRPPAKKGKKKTYYIDTNEIHVPRAGMEMTSFLKEGLIENWEVFEELMDYTYKSHILSSPNLHPVLMSEPPWNLKLKREKLGELMFEKYDIPALFLCKNAVLSAFASGRSSGLVLDSGATHTTAVPVYDGYCYGQATVKSTLAGDSVTEQCLKYFEQNGIDVIPSYKVGSKEQVGERETPIWKAKKIPEVTKSFHNAMVTEILRDFQAAVLEISDRAFDQEAADKMPALHYEFPNGYNQDFISERLSIGESLFDANFHKNMPNHSGLLTVPRVVTTSIGMCDIDMRSALYSGIIVTGGNSLIRGFTERLHEELGKHCPASCKLRIHSAPTPAERRFGSWIGGSILASLGSFQQMWISKLEYEESGKSILDKKCP